MVPDGAAFPRSRLDELTEQAKKAGAAGLAWFRVVDGDAARARDGPLARHLSEQEVVRVLERTKAAPGDLVLAVSDSYAHGVHGARHAAHGHRGAAGEPGTASLRVGRRLPDVRGSAPTARRSRRTTPSPCPIPRTCRCWRPTRCAVRSQAYDLVLNGWELGSGSVRIHHRDIQEQVFAALGIGAEEAEARFGFLLGAFRYGAPPHAGFAVGIDRLVAILAGEENIREVIAYPKTQSGADPLTGAPTPLPAATLAELGIRVVVLPPSADAEPGRAGA